MLFMARRKGLKPIDHTSELGLTRTRATLETVWLLAYMLVTMGFGMAFNLHTHIHFRAFADGTQSIFGQEAAASSLLWMGYNALVYAVLPLGFPKPRVFVPFAVVAGFVGFVPFVTPDFWGLPVSSYLLTLVLIRSRNTSARGDLYPSSARASACRTSAFLGDGGRFSRNRLHAL